MSFQLNILCWTPIRMTELDNIKIDVKVITPTSVYNFIVLNIYDYQCSIPTAINSCVNSFSFIIGYINTLRCGHDANACE